MAQSPQYTHGGEISKALARNVGSKHRESLKLDEVHASSITTSGLTALKQLDHD